MSDTLSQIQADIATASTALTNAATLLAQLTPPTTVISTPAALDAAIAAASDGATLTLSSSLVYPTPFTLSKGLTLQNSAVLPGRATLVSAMPRFSAGVTLTSQTPTSLIGIEVRHTDPSVDILVLNGGKKVIDGCRILGDATNGAKRGIQGNATDVTVVRTYIGDVKLKGQDTQAFCAWDAPGPFLIDDCYMSAAGETVLFGGADATSTAHIPSDITISNSTLTKDPTWQTQGWQVKNVLEFKAARRAKVTNCDLSYSWSGFTQDGYLLVITVRNQDGSAPFTNIDQIDIEGCTFHDGAAWCQLLGEDYTNPSGLLTNLTIKGNKIYNLDPWKYVANGAPGSDKMILVQAQGGGPQGVTFDSNTCSGANIGSVLYFASGDGTKAQNFTFTNNICPASTYGVMGAGTSPDLSLNANGLTWQTFVQGGVLSNNTVAA